MISPSIADDITQRDALKMLTPFVAPQSALEHDIAQTFATIMKVAPVGMDDDFYDLGGDSLMGEQISLELQRKTGRDFAISNLFSYPTPRLIADFLSEGAKPLEADRPPIFVVHGRGGYTVPRPEFHDGLRQGSRLVMFELPGIRGTGDFPRDIPAVAEAYVAQITRDYPSGPILLAAFCNGGLIAIEMANRLERMGREIAGLVLLDPSVPSRLRKRHRLLRRLERTPDDLATRLRFALAFGSTREPEPMWSALRGKAEQMLRLGFFLVKETGIGRLLKKGVFWKYRDAGLRVLPRAWLIVAYRFAWPQPYAGKVSIIASQERALALGNPDSVWGRLLPRRKVEILADTHHDIGQANASEVAERMESLLLDDLARTAGHRPSLAQAAS